MYKSKILFIFGLIIVFSSCRDHFAPPEFFRETAVRPPVRQRLRFTEIEKIDLTSVKPIKISPVVKKVMLDKLVVRSNDTSDYKPFTHPTVETNLDYNTLPSKNLNIYNLPSKPLIFKTILLPPPSLFKAGLPQLKKSDQPLLFELGDNQGLTAKNITCLFIDKDGFLWIATDQGLYRYDGEYFSLYIKGPFDFLIFSMVQDKSGNIWMGTENGGLEVLDPGKGLLKYVTTRAGISNNNVVRMVMDKTQNLWCTTFGGGIDIIDTKNQSVKVLDKSSGLSENSCIGITADNHNNFWITTLAGLNVINAQNNRISYVTALHGLKSDSLSSIICDNKGRIWVSDFSGGEFNVIDPQNKKLTIVKETKKTGEGIWSLLKDHDGQIWAGTSSNGVQIIDFDGKKTRSISVTKGTAENRSELVQSIVQDNQGQTWIATRSGLNLLKVPSSIHKSIGKGSIRTLYEDEQGRIWEGSTTSGINILNRKTNIIEHLDKTNGISNDTIQSITGKNGQIFVCSNGGLDIIDQSKQITTHIGMKEGLVDKIINKVVVDQAGQVWIGGAFGLDIYNPEQKTLKHAARPFGFLSGLHIRDMCVDHAGNLWLSTFFGGIFKVSIKNSKVEHIINSPLLKREIIRVLMPDSNGNVWIGSEKGIFIANDENESLTSFTTSQGLINNNVIALSHYQNRIYAGTIKGITVITLPSSGIGANQKWEAESFGKVYGLTKLNTGYYNTDVVSRDGIYWWGDSGITLFNVSQKDTTAHPAYIVRINVTDQPVSFEDYSRRELNSANALANTIVSHRGEEKKGAEGLPEPATNGFSWDKISGPYNMPVNLELPYNQNYLRFDFTSLNLLKSDSTWYRYILLGADKKWTLSNFPSSGNYFSLAPGRYTFKVISKGLNGIWGKPAELNFTIKPPMWQTWWAYLLYTLLIIASAWSVIYYRAIQHLREKQVLEDKVRLRTEEVLLQKEEIEAQRDNLENALSKLKATQAQLIQSEKMASMGELTAGIAHEIQNPLNFVNNFSELSIELLSEMATELNDKHIDAAAGLAKDIKQNLEKVLVHGKRADSIIKGMQQHSRVSKGSKEPTNIAKFAGEYLNLAYQGWRAKEKNFNARLITRFDDSLPSINVVQQDIAGALVNLYNNAFYAVNMKQKNAGDAYIPEVEVSVGLTTATIAGMQGVIIEVKDNGTGIPESIKNKIMQPFFTTKPTGEGVGLGLSITYDIVVKGHGGKIELNTIEGEFTEFKIILFYNAGSMLFT